MTTLDHVTTDFERKVFKCVRLVSEGNALYGVFTPFSG